MVQTEVDTSNGVMFPFYDPDSNIVYLCGKVKPSKLVISNIYPLYFYFPMNVGRLGYSVL
jgi:hypothetical protein